MGNKKTSTTKTIETKLFPPVVAVLGHVDHGKTTLLDAIRKTSHADREKGGITQKIGASMVDFTHDGVKRNITFIDTPGHEAFTKMRGRGAQASDIGLLIVSSADGVQPQTRESISALRESQTPFIVVLTKADLPTKNPDKIKQQLTKEDVKLEGYGGDVPVIEVSAKTGQNIQELLDLILLMYDLHKPADYDKKVSVTAPLQAIVIESKLDTRAGPKATVIVKNGSIHIREELQADGQIFRIRTLLDDKGKSVQSVTVGSAVEVLGFEKVPTVGSIISHKSQSMPVPTPKSQVTVPLMREMVYKKDEKSLGLSIILIADTQGSLEAIVNSLPKGIRTVAKKTGDVSEADILLAKSTESIILSFNTKIKPDIQKLALTEKVLLRNYEVIYELLKEIEDAQEGKMLSQMEQIFGTAKILAKFPFEKTFAFGVSVNRGRIAKGDHVRVMRSEKVLGETLITSLRVGKNPVSKVEKGNEAGTILSPILDIQVGDMILSHS